MSGHTHIWFDHRPSAGDHEMWCEVCGEVKAVRQFHRRPAWLHEDSQTPEQIVADWLRDRAVSMWRDESIGTKVRFWLLTEADKLDPKIEP